MIDAGSPGIILTNMNTITTMPKRTGNSWTSLFMTKRGKFTSSLFCDTEAPPRSRS